MGRVDFQRLSDAVLDAFGDSVTVTRGVVSVTLAADVQKTARTFASVQDGAALAQDEITFLFDVSAFAATTLVNPRPGDKVTFNTIARRVTSVELEVGDTMWRVSCRSEKKK